MKPQTLPVKRRPVPKGIFKRLRAVTGNRKQRVAAAAAGAPEMESEDSSSKISRALTIIFLIHIVAIGLIFVHTKFLDGRTPDEPKSAKAVKQEAVIEVATLKPRLDLPRLSSGEKPYIVRAGDNYARIAAVLGVEEGDLRLINKHVPIEPGLLLKIPAKRAAATAEATELVAMHDQAPADDSDGLVPAVDTSAAPRAKLVRGIVSPSAEAKATPVVASGKSYVVKNGDSVWRIANKFKVNQDALMKANGISDAGKLKVGMSLAIPR
jgi:LysM repeat protein